MIGPLDPPAGFGGVEGLSSFRGGDAGADEVSPPPAFGGESGFGDEDEPDAPPSGFGLPLPISIPGIESPPASFTGDRGLASPGGDAGAEFVKPPAGFGGESGIGGELLSLSPPLGLGGNEEPPLPFAMPGGIALPAASGLGAPGGPISFKSSLWIKQESSK